MDWNGRAEIGLVEPMAERSSDEAMIVVRRGPRWGRIATFASVGVLLLLGIAIAIVWIQRRPIAQHPKIGEQAIEQNSSTPNRCRLRLGGHVARIIGLRFVFGVRGSNTCRYFLFALACN